MLHLLIFNISIFYPSGICVGLCTCFICHYKKEILNGKWWGQIMAGYMKIGFAEEIGSCVCSQCKLVLIANCKGDCPSLQTAQRKSCHVESSSSQGPPVSRLRNHIEFHMMWGTVCIKWSLSISGITGSSYHGMQTLYQRVWVYPSLGCLETS